MSISEIIKACGGPKAISSASEQTRRPITVWAVHKWRLGGIPDHQWPLVMRLAPSVTVNDLYQANQAVAAEGNAVAA